MTEKPKSNSVVTDVWDNTTQTLTFNVLGAGEIRFELGKVSRENLDYAAVYGFRQRLADKAAMAKGATAQQKFEAIKGLADWYMTGTADWGMAKGATGPRLDEWVLRALAELKATDVGTIRTLAVETAQKHKASVVDIVAAWGRIEQVATKANELRAKATGLSAEKVAEFEKELGI